MLTGLKVVCQKLTDLNFHSKPRNAYRNYASSRETTIATTDVLCFAIKNICTNANRRFIMDV